MSNHYGWHGRCAFTILRSLFDDHFVKQRPDDEPANIRAADHGTQKSDSFSHYI